MRVPVANTWCCHCSRFGLSISCIGGGSIYIFLNVMGRLKVVFHLKLYTSPPLLLPDIKGLEYCGTGLSIHLLAAHGQLRSRHSPFCCSSPLSSLTWFLCVNLNRVTWLSHSDSALRCLLTKILQPDSECASCWPPVSACHNNYPSGHVPNWLEFNFNCLSSLTFRFLCSYWAVLWLCLSQ